MPPSRLDEGPGDETAVDRGTAVLEAAFETDDSALFAQAITLLRAAAGELDDADPERAQCLTNLGVALLRRHERTGSRELLEEAVDVARAAVDAAAPTDDDRGHYLGNLSMALLTRFEQAQEPHDLDGAIDAAERACALASADDPGSAGLLSILASALQARYEAGGAMEELDRAIGLDRRAVAVAEPDDPDLLVMQSNLAAALLLRSDYRSEDLDEAIAITARALADAPPEHPGLAPCLANAATALRWRFMRSRERGDLDRAIELARRASELAPAPDIDVGLVLSILATVLLQRFHALGRRTDLDDAIDAARRAVDATSSGHRFSGRYVDRLAECLQTRFEQAGTATDLDEAVTRVRDALARAVQGRWARPNLLTTLSGLLSLRFERAAQRSDLDDAMTAAREAVSGGQAGNPGHEDRVSNLATALLHRGVEDDSLIDMDESIALFTDIAGSCDGGSRPAYHMNLCAALLERFERAGDAADLDASVDAARQAVRGTDPEDPDSAEYHTNLGVALRTRHEQTSNPADLDESIRAFRAAADAATSPPRRRAAAYAEWGRLATIDGRWADAVHASGRAIDLLVAVAPRGLARRDQEHALSVLDGIATQATACALQAGETRRAVELFEHGRAVLLAQTLDTRTDITTLADRHPDLAARFVELRDALERLPAHPVAAAWPGEDGVGSVVWPRQRVVEHRRGLAADFTQAIEEIRERPGFEGFLLPARFDDLLQVAAEGPVVLVNVDDIRSDALVLMEGGVRVIGLPALTPSAVGEHARALLAAAEEFDERRLAGEQEWLWDSLAGPVLDGIGIQAPPGTTDVWPRVWWCPSGLLGALPIPAAGHHETRRDPVPLTVCDRAVSSSTPTLRALMRSRARASPGEEPAQISHCADLVVVAMPQTPASSDLPGAAAELALLRELFGERIEVLVGVDRTATHDSVIAALTRHACAHLACHCESNLADPSLGRLLLEDHERRPMTVGDIGRLQLANAELAFLSACRTAGVDRFVPDEAVHFATAFQLAGYRHVIGTFWEIDDRSATRIAAEVYAGLATGEAAAVALHGATIRLRATSPGQPRSWAAHVHLGA